MTTEPLETTKKTSKAKRDQRQRQRDRLRAEVAKRDLAITGLRADRDRLRRAVIEHRTAIHNAGTVRVDSRDEVAAEVKHAADARLWEIATSKDSPS